MISFLGVIWGASTLQEGWVGRMLGVWADRRLSASQGQAGGNASHGENMGEPAPPHGGSLRVKQEKALVRFASEATADEQMEAGSERCIAEMGRTSPKIVAVESEERDGCQWCF